MRVFLILLLGVCLSPVNAETNAGKKLWMTPSNFIPPFGPNTNSSDAISPQGLRNDTKNLWVVFSDRDNNEAYTDATGAKVLSKLNFMQPFFVMDVKNDYVHLVKWVEQIDDYLDKGQKDYTLSQELPDCGWVHKSKLLLWTHCLLDPNSGYFMKGLTINPLNSKEAIQDYITKPDSLKLYNNPNLRQPPNDHQLRLFDFLFVYKKEGNACLVAGQTHFYSAARTAQRESHAIYGWVSSQFIKEWGQRICLEPNSEPNAANDRKMKNIKAAIFYDSTNAMSFAKTGKFNENDVAWDEDPYDIRMKTDLKRFPILNADLNNISNSIIHTGVTTAIFKDGKQVQTNEQQGEILRKYNKLRENMRNVNIVFVVDGTEQIKDFKTNISEVITNIARKIEDETGSRGDDAFGSGVNNYKLGLVAYRDDKLKNCPVDYEPVQYYPLTDDAILIRDKFNNDVKLNAGCNKNESYRAVYKGLEYACRLFQGREYQSNIIFLIGAAGNLKDNPYRDDIAKLLYQYSVGLLAFQIKHPMAQAYFDFTDQISDILKGEMQRYQDTLNTMPLENIKKAGKVVFDINDRKQNLLKFDCPNKRPLPGEILFSDPNVTISPEILSREVSAAFDSLRESKENLFEAMDFWLGGQGVRKEINPGMLAFLKKLNIDGETLRKSMNEKNYQLFVDGYLSLNCNNLNDKLFTYSVFLSRSELEDLLGVLKTINVQGNGSDKDNRNAMVAAMKKEVLALFGPTESKEVLKKMSIDDLIKRITGVQSRNSLFKKYTIQNLLNSKLVPLAEFDQISASIANAVQDLNEYKMNDSYTFKSLKEEDFFWVPQSLFP